MGHFHMVCKGIPPTPGNKIIEINKLMNSVMEPDYEEDILHKLPSIENTKWVFPYSNLMS